MMVFAYFCVFFHVLVFVFFFFFFFSSRRRHTRSLCDWSSDMCSSDLGAQPWISRAVSGAPLAFIGRVSYSWYLWHWPVLLLGKEVWPSAHLGWNIALLAVSFIARSEERRVGKECRSRWAQYYQNEKDK